MLAAAIQQYLVAHGVSRAMVDGFGDYTTAGAPAVSVHAESDTNVAMDEDTYSARVQIRSRAPNAIAAENAARSAFELLVAADGETLAFNDPTGAENRQYLIEAISVVNRPTWYPTPELGEETSCNLRMFVTEL